jgi:hypothetical protein
MRRAILLGVLFLVAAVGTAAAQPYGDRAGPRAAVWDSTGWTLLGEQTVDGRRRADSDRVNVGKYEGRFSKLTIVVTDSDLELLEFTVNFPRGQRWAPAGVAHYFRENSRTRVIDLPGDDRRIESIDLKYRNLPGGGKARVQVWGFKTTGAPPPPPREFTWDNRGWQMLGEQVVDYGRRADRDRINVGKYEGRFSKLTVVVLDSDLELLNFDVNFPRGQKWSPALNHYFRENQRTRVIDLPGDDRRIESIDMRYKNLPGGGRARVQVWGFKTTGAPPPPPPREFTWDNRGWQMLGEQVVDYGRRADRDRINVGRYEGRFSKLTVVVLDSDLEMLSFQVNFPRGRPYAPAMAHYFRENQRTRVIDLPGDDRTIQSIDMRYKNLPGGGRARVQVWGFKTDNAAPPPPREFTWDNRGWRMLGEQRVNGRVDRDRINISWDEGNRFEKLMIVVLDSDLELLDFDVQFTRGDPWRPNVKQYFREGTRTRSIDLPGDRARRIKHIDLKYKNLPGGGSARVQVWGK